MYIVITIYDSTRSRSYYYSYKESEDTTLGNLVCDTLPPYQDIKMARACYHDSDNNQWLFDEEKYAEIVAEAKAKAEAEAEAEAEADATPTNLELNEGLLEIAELMVCSLDAISELGELIISLDERMTASEGG